MLKASQKEDGSWVLNGVKRFITNGDSDIHLVLARSEEGTKDGRGLSMFIYDKRNLASFFSSTSSLRSLAISS